MTRRAARRPRLLETSLPRHPYRDAAILHGCLGALIVLVAWLTGGNNAKTLGIAAAYFVAATAWSWWRLRQRAHLAATNEES
jgi:hypothetical protein